MGAARQGEDLAARGEDEDFVRVEVDLEAFEEVARFGVVRLQLHERLQPGVGLALEGVDALAGVFVDPVGGHAVFGEPVLGLGAYLDFDGNALRADDGGVQRLVAVGLGQREVVLELAGHRLEGGVQRADGEVAALFVGHDDAKAEEVEDLLEAQVLAAHFLVDGIEVLAPAADLGFYPPDDELAFDECADLVEEFVTRPERGFDGVREHGMAPRVAVLEGEVLEFAKEGVEPEPVGDGGVDLEGFLRDAAALGRGDGTQRAHVVRAVGQLDEDDA